MKNLTVALAGLTALLGPMVGLQGVATAQGVGTRIAYVQCGPDLDVWYVRCRIHILVDGSDIDVGPGAAPKWSPDGSRVAFSGNSDYYEYGDGEILVARAVDGSVANLTNHPAWDAGPAWFADGRIAFVSNRDGAFELYVMNGDGSNPTRLTNESGFSGWFSVSPDGDRIVFVSDRDGAPELYVMAADGGNPSRLTYNSGFKGQLVWSRDGARLAFDCEVESGNRDICAINSDGTHFGRLTNDPGFDSGVVFSPIDDRLAFAAEGQIVTMDAEGTVTPVGAAGAQPAWSPDGTQLAFVGTTTSWLGRCYFGEGAHNADDFCLPVPDIYVVGLDGTGLTRITSGDLNIEWFRPLPGRPLPAFTYDYNGSTCNFDASGSVASGGTITRYAWDFGDDTNGAGATTGHTYAAGRRYIVTLTVTDSAGETGTLSIGVDANASPVASFSATCNDGGACTFDASASLDPDGALIAYAWQFGDGYTAYSSRPTHTYTTAGTFTVRLTIWDNSGLYSAVGTQQQNVTVLNVNTPPVASFTSACTGLLTCSFNASASSDSDGTIAGYAWNFGDGTSGSGAAINHTYATSGTYTITLTVTDNGGATSARVQRVTVVPSDMHVGDLDSSNSNQQSRWTAAVTITMHDATHGPVANVSLSGAWYDGSIASCVTNTSGQCVISRSAIPKNVNSVSFTVTGAARAGYAYVSSANHDADSDSSGTTINVTRP